MRELITKDNSEFYALLEKHNIELTPNWKYSIENGTAYLYDKRGVVCFNKENVDGHDLLVINSGTLDGGVFTKQMIKDIISAGDYYDKMVIQSSNKGIFNYMNKKGFIYNEEQQCYISSKHGVRYSNGC